MDIYTYKLIDTREKYDKLLSGGMFWIYYPHLSGVWEEDIEVINVKIGKPPLGLKPRKFHEEEINKRRFGEVCEAIENSFKIGHKIDIEWVKEYNELVDWFKKNYH